MKNKDVVVLEKIMDYQSAWDTVKEDLPALKLNVNRILEKNRTDTSEY